MIDALGWICFGAACLAASVGILNLILLRAPRAASPDAGALVSILIPARNEEANIAAALDAALASRGAAVEVLVMNDGSTDSTAAIVEAYAARDSRMRLLQAPALPPGWSGKMHACQRLAEAARGSHFLFVDADVRLAPHAAAGLAAHAERTGAALVSGVPRQEMKTLGEMLTVPTINLLLIGYLPILGLRLSGHPAFGAACGQLILVEREAYREAGGHAAIRATMHDGLRLPRLFREKGFKTDLVNGARLARCRMYWGFGESWNGFAKNASEGMAKPVALPIWTFLLGAGHVLPPVLAIFSGPAFWALLVSLALRTAIALKARETWLTIPLHPLSTATALAIQWTALARVLRGRQAGWKGRAYPAKFEP